MKLVRALLDYQSPISFKDNLCYLRNRFDNLLMNCRAKILSQTQLSIWRDKARSTGKKVVATNGCFDLLHAGHITYLEAARNAGDLLLVGLNSDAAVRELKGAGRPINSEQDRALVIAALECVDAVFIFPELRATNFLHASSPDIYVKGGDYSLETLNPEERQIVERTGGKIIIHPFVPGKSSTALLQKLDQGP